MERAQPSATIRNRSRQGYRGRLMLAALSPTSAEALQPMIAVANSANVHSVNSVFITCLLALRAESCGGSLFAASAVPDEPGVTSRPPVPQCLIFRVT